MSFALQAIYKVITKPNKQQESSKTCTCCYPGHFIPVINSDALAHADVLMAGFMCLRNTIILFFSYSDFAFMPLFFQDMNASHQELLHSVWEG